MIADAVSSRSSKEDNNLIVFLETERMRAEERERIRQDERADERRREDTVSSPPLTQTSVTSSPATAPQFDGQDFLERELLRRTTGV